MSAIADMLEARAPALATLVTREMGKPVAGAEGEIRKCAWVCRHYAEHGPSMLEAETASIDGADVRVLYDPIGS